MTKGDYMLNYHELRQNYKLYRQEQQAADHAFTFAVCVMLASLTVILAVMVK